MCQALPARRAAPRTPALIHDEVTMTSAHYVIVGSGIAGLSAAEALRASEPHAVISMVSEEPHPFYSRPGLAYLLRGDLPEKQLVIRTRDDVRALNVHRVTAQVEQLLGD